ncbi:MAG: hypothetical protein PUC65_12945 [Clostridiales bacterium]|nr:hypothetical protein [Clostridiales bacterium]
MGENNNQLNQNRKASVYHRIYHALQEDHTLPINFELEEKDNKETLRFAPGALEGIFGHHTSGNKEENKLYDFLLERINCKPEIVMEELESSDLVSNETVISDGLIKQIYENKELFSADSLYHMAYSFILDGTKEYTVKLGLSLLALFDIDDDPKLKEKLINLAMWEGFTDYVLQITHSWTDKNHAYFQLAKRLNGWGKINAVECLEPETDEIKEWILCEGCKNSIMYSYLALICAEKCDLYHVLKTRNLTLQEFNGTRDIIDGLLEEGPCDGISVIENAYELLFMFVSQYEKFKLNIEDINLLDSIQDYVKEDDDRDQTWEERINEKIDSYISQNDIKSSILSALYEKKQWYAIQVARKYKIDISNEYLEQLRKDFDAYVNYIYYLFGINKYVEEAVKICEDHLEYEKVAAGMGKQLGVGRTEHWSIDMVVQYLDAYPYHGAKLIKASINSPITRYRNMAAKALEGWKLKLNMSLSEISTELYHEIQEVYPIEVDDKLKERWRLLLQ